MSEKLETVTAEGLQSLIQFVKESAEVVGEQAPLLVQEIVTYGRVSNTVYIVISLLLIAVIFKAIHWVWDDKNDCPEVLQMHTSVFGGIAFIGAMIGFCASISPLMSAWFAPRLYVLDQIKLIIN